jgi:hypothetical protein
MRSGLLVVMACGQAFGQLGPLTIGVKVGVPLSDSFEVGTQDSCPGLVCDVSNYSSKTKRYTLGPMVELRLPHGLSVESDVLYKRLNYDFYSYHRSPSSGQIGDFTGTRANRWTCPILLKWRHNLNRLTPFIEGGVSIDHISGVESDFTTTIRGLFGDVTEQGRGTTSNPPELMNRSGEGLVFGGGLEFRLARSVRFMPEIRYTRWWSKNFTRDFAPEKFGTNQNETAFLVGFAF